MTEHIDAMKSAQVAIEAALEMHGPDHAGLLLGALAKIDRAIGASRVVAQDAVPPKPMNFFSENVDAWGALEWFNRLASAVRQQDAAVLAGDEMAMETCRNVASSSAMRLVRDYEQQVRAALAAHTEGMRASVPDARAISDAYSDWAWEKEGQPVGLMLPNESARAGFFAGVKWMLARSQGDQT